MLKRGDESRLDLRGDDAVGRTVTVRTPSRSSRKRTLTATGPMIAQSERHRAHPQGVVRDRFSGDVANQWSVRLGQRQ